MVLRALFYGVTCQDLMFIVVCLAFFNAKSFVVICDGQAPETKPPVEKAPKKPTVKATEKKGKTVEVVQEEPLDPVAEKLLQQR